MQQVCDAKSVGGGSLRVKMSLNITPVKDLVLL